MQGSAIKQLLRQEDVEGLIALGAPPDEYDTEVEEIVAALAKIPVEQRTEAQLVAVISLVWAKAFDLSAADIQIRMQNFERLARALLV